MSKRKNIFKNFTLGVGKVISVSESVVLAVGLKGVRTGEIVTFGNRTALRGLVMSFDRTYVKITLVSGDPKRVYAGDVVERTGRLAETISGWGIFSRILTPLGFCLNLGKFPLETLCWNEIFCLRKVLIDSDSPTIIERQRVRKFVETGINSVDCFLPIGCGQRELIVGDLGTGKTSLAVSFLLNQRNSNSGIWRYIEQFNYNTDRHQFFIPCIYVSVGGKRAEIKRLERLLDVQNASSYTILVYAGASDLPGVQYLAPLAGCAMGEWYRNRGHHSIVIYDDLSNHATAYRHISLMLRRPPGREAYPGDMFYVHAKLLERSAQLHIKLGGGSLTAFPIVETKQGDLSGYIPTNVISITDGQIFLSSKLKNQGMMPAVDLNLSVSRVGARAQPFFLSDLSKKIKISYSFYRAYASVEQVGGEVDPTVQSYLNRGKKIVEYLRQDLYKTESLYKQLFCFYCISSGFLDKIQNQYVLFYFRMMFHPGILDYALDNAENWFLVIDTEFEMLGAYCKSKKYNHLKNLFHKFITVFDFFFTKNYNELIDERFNSIAHG